MKSLEINAILTDLTHKPILNPPEPGKSSEPAKIKDILIQYLVGYKGKEPKQVMLARKVAQKVFDFEGLSLEVEDAEFDLIEEAVKEPQHNALIIAPIYEMLKAAKEEK